MTTKADSVDRSAVHSLLRSTRRAAARKPGGSPPGVRNPAPTASLRSAQPSVATRPTSRPDAAEPTPKPAPGGRFDETLVRGAESIIAGVRDGVGQLRDALGIEPAANDGFSRALDSFQNVIKRATLDQRSGGFDLEEIEKRFTGAFAELSAKLGSFVGETPASKPDPSAPVDLDRAVSSPRVAPGDAALEALSGAFERGLSSLLSALGGGFDVRA